MSSEKKIDRRTNKPICDCCEEGRYSLKSRPVRRKWNEFIAKQIEVTAQNEDEELIECSKCHTPYVVKTDRNTSFFCWPCELAKCYICHRELDIGEYFNKHQSTCSPLDLNEAERKVTRLGISS